MMTLSAPLLVALSMPIFGALVGWGTNYLAVKMIFRPRKPVNVLGFTFHGLIPQRQGELAKTIGATVADSLVSHHDIRAAFLSGAQDATFRQLLEDEVERFIRHRLRKHKLLGLVVRDRIADELRNLVVEQLEGALPAITERVTQVIESSVDVRAIVERRVTEFDLASLEQMVQGIAGRELRAIERWGGALGFVVGLVQSALVLLQS